MTYTAAKLPNGGIMPSKLASKLLDKHELVIAPRSAFLLDIEFFNA